MTTGFTRRRVLSTSLYAAPLLLLPGWAAGAAGGSGTVACAPTPASGEGPFYPTTAIETRTNLIRPGAGIFGGGAGSGNAGGAAAGGAKPIVVMGQVTDRGCRPLGNAEVEIWQADTLGHYHHPGDSSGKQLDPNFLYWGKAVTDREGRYRFVTILPAAYPAGNSWMRPPHIHFKVRARPAGTNPARPLTTQMYFPGQPLNERDFLFRSIPPGQRPAAIAAQIPKPADESLDAGFYRFNLGLG